MSWVPLVLGGDGGAVAGQPVTIGRSLTLHLAIGGLIIIIFIISCLFIIIIIIVIIVIIIGE